MNEITILAGIILSIIAPVFSAIFIKTNFSTEVKSAIASLVGLLFGLILSVVQANITHAFDGKDTLVTIVGIIIASHTFYEMFLKEAGKWVQTNIGVK